jgi:PPP family 3-phenylpropionic acid transporter
VYRAIGTYIIAYSAVAAWAPYLSAYYNRGLGIPLGLVGLLMALTSTVSLVGSPLWGTLHDRNPQSGLLLPVAATIAAAGALGMLILGASPLLPVAAAIFALGISGMFPMMDVRVLEMVSADRTRYARVRVWGSISFIVLAPLIGMLTATHGLQALFWVMIPALLAGGLAVTTLPGRDHEVRATSMRRAPMTVLRHRPIAICLIGSFLAWAAVSSQNAFFTIYLIQLGASTDMAGSAWSIAALLEVPAMFFFPALARRFGVERLIVLGAVLLVVRQTANVVFAEPVVLMGFSLIQGIGYSFVLIGSVTFMSHQAPRGTAATAQGIFNAVAGSMAVIAGAGIGGQLAGLLTIRGLYVVSACLGASAVIVIAAAVLPVARARALEGATQPGPGSQPELLHDGAAPPADQAPQALPRVAAGPEATDPAS